METTDKKHIAVKIWANVSRLLLGCVFVFSGFVKAIDPLGFLYKLQDYAEAFGLISLIPSPTTTLFISGMLLAVIEFSVGVFLLLGIRKRMSNYFVLLFMLVMTPLSLYIALTDPVSDCGCFGDALTLTNWQTFSKNIVLLIAALSVIKWQNYLVNILSPKIEWILSLYTFLYGFVLSIYCLNHLPVMDFRPYKIGVDIKASMEVPEGAKPNVYESRFVMEKDGVKKEFGLENYPDSTWTFVESRSVLKEKGYTPAIRDFSIVTLEEGNDVTDQILSDSSYVFLLLAHRIEEADDSYIDLINEIYDYSIEHNYKFYALTASSLEAIETWCDMTGAEYPFGLMDEIALKTMLRSNPGLLLLKNGVVINKWSDADLPDEYVLTDSLDKLPIGEQPEVNNLYTIGYALLWFVIPLSLVFVLNAFVRRRERKLQIKQKKVEEQPQPTCETVEIEIEK